MPQISPSFPRHPAWNRHPGSGLIRNAWFLSAHAFEADKSVSDSEHIAAHAEAAGAGGQGTWSRRRGMSMMCSWGV